MERLLSFSNMTQFQNRQAGKLSGGMKQKLGLACALIHTPKVLFLDEPTNGVDPVSRRDFWQILYRLLREGVTIFVSTAYLDEAERASRIGLVHKGRLLAAGTPAEVKKLMSEAILEIRCSEPRRATGLLPGASSGRRGQPVRRSRSLGYQCAGGRGTTGRHDSPRLRRRRYRHSQDRPCARGHLRFCAREGERENSCARMKTWRWW